MAKETKRMLTQAIMNARKEISLTTSGKNNHQGWKYATIEDIEDAIAGPLEKQNCDAWHERFILDSSQCLRTIIEHVETGERREDVCFLESEKPGNQGMGSALTYMRKDAFRCLLRLSTKDDDSQSEQDHLKKANEKKAGDFNVEELRRLIEQSANPSKLMGQVLHYNKVSSLKELGEQQCARATYRVKEILNDKK